MEESHTLIIQYMYLKNKLIVDALLWCDLFPLSLSHLFYFSFFFYRVNSYTATTSTKKRPYSKKPKNKNPKPKTSNVHNRSL